MWGLLVIVPCRGQRTGTLGLRAVWLQTVLTPHSSPSWSCTLPVLVLAFLSTRPSAVLVWPSGLSPSVLFADLYWGLWCVVRLRGISYSLFCVYAKAPFPARPSCSVPLSCRLRSLAEVEELENVLPSLSTVSV